MGRSDTSVIETPLSVTLWVIALGFLLFFLGVVVHLVCIVARARRRYSAVIAAEKLSIPQLQLLREEFAEMRPPASNKLYWVVGRASAVRPGGALSASLTGTACVWHGQRYTTTHIGIISYSSPDDWASNYQPQDSIEECGSMVGFELRFGGETIGVDPSGMWPDGAQVIKNRYERRSPIMSNDPVSFKEEEYVLREGSKVRVLGVIRHQSGRGLVVGAPQDSRQPFVISTRSRKKIVTDERESWLLDAWLGGLGAAVVLGWLSGLLLIMVRG